MAPPPPGVEKDLLLDLLAAKGGGPSRPSLCQARGFRAQVPQAFHDGRHWPPIASSALIKMMGHERRDTRRTQEPRPHHLPLDRTIAVIAIPTKHRHFIGKFFLRDVELEVVEAVFADVCKQSSAGQ